VSDAIEAICGSVVAIVLIEAFFAPIAQIVAAWRRGAVRKDDDE
jgi:hypothetical protein